MTDLQNPAAVVVPLLEHVPDAGRSVLLPPLLPGFRVVEADYLVHEAKPSVIFIKALYCI
jgi:hypothetical protein